MELPSSRKQRASDSVVMARREIVVSTMKATWAFFERRRRALVLLRPSVLHTTTVGTQVPGLGQLMRVQGGGPGTLPARSFRPSFGKALLFRWRLRECNRPITSSTLSYGCLGHLALFARVGVVVEFGLGPSK